MARPQQFFKILLPSSSQQLRIPAKFVPQLANTAAGEGRRASTATILSPLGKFWHVEVCRDGPEGGEATSFGRGWQEFVAAHGLNPGHLLVFSYEGNMVFTLKVFDHSGCLKEHYNSTSTSSNNNNNNSNVVVPAVVDHRRRSRRRQRTSGVAREGTLNNGEGPSLGRDPIGERQQRVSEPNLSNGEREEEEEEESPKTKEKLRNQKASKKNCYEKRMKLYNIEKYTIISKRFCTSHGLTASHEVVIKDSRRRSWAVNFGIGSAYCYLGKGWRDFCLANKVKVGDTCIFKVAGKNELHVSVVRK